MFASTYNTVADYIPCHSVALSAEKSRDSSSTSGDSHHERYYPYMPAATAASNPNGICLCRNVGVLIMHINPFIGAFGAATIQPENCIN